MKTNREKELDDLFRLGLENPGYDADFRESDWEAMEALLDKKKSRGLVYLMPVLSGVAAILVLAFGWFLLNHNSDKQNIVKNEGKSRFKYIEKGVVKSIDTVSDGQATMQQTALNKDTVSNNHQHAVKGLTLPDKTVRNILVYTAVKKPFISGFKNNKTAGTTVNPTAPDAVIAYDDSGLAKFEANNALTANNPQLGLSDINNVPQIQGTLPAENKPEILSPVKGKNIVKQLNNKRPQFAITVMASPDINGVGSFKNSMVGTNAGLLFSVGLSKRFTVSTGVLYSKKPYLTNFADYHSTYKFKTDPQNVTADCRVLDIPLNIDYQVYKHARNTFSLGTGISSYLMLRENYHYNYEIPGTTGPTDYNIANRNKHILGVLNLEATYQRQLNSKFAIGIQPYMKVPLTDIGYSQVKLQSAGLAVGVTWNINSHR